MREHDFVIFVCRFYSPLALRTASSKAKIITGLMEMGWANLDQLFFEPQYDFGRLDLEVIFFWKMRVRQTILFLVVWRTRIFMSPKLVCKSKLIQLFWFFFTCHFQKLLRFPYQSNIFENSPKMMPSKIYYFYWFSKLTTPLMKY